VSAFWSLARLRLLDVLRSRSSAGFVLVFPVVLLVIVGFVFREGHPFERRTILVVDDAAVQAAAAPLRDFEELRVEIVRSEAEGLGKLRAKMASAVLAPGKDVEGPRLLVGPRDRVLARGLAELLPPATRVEPVEASRWGYVHYLFPGVLTFSVMLAGLFATGYTLVLYRQNRFLKKLATTPMPRIVFVLSLVAGRSVLVLAQVALLVACAAFVFEVPLTLGGALGTIGVSMLGLMAFLGLGFVLACVVENESLVVDLVSAVNVPLVFLSEIFFPLDALPRPLALLGEALPSTAMVRLLRSFVLYGGVDPSVLGLQLCLLCGWTVVAFAVGLKLFRWA
jgi:ABC-type polysaccharide/polyol phosphate export permease